MKRIVDIHQGQIIIRNREQGGLEVVISLPIPSEKTDEPQNNTIDKIRQTLTGHF